MRRLALCVLLLLSMSAAAIDPLPFADAAEEQRFRTLTAELRCVMCQNQSLADSNAGIANDLRREIFDLMRSGKSDEEIKIFLTDRYGDFVLYRPEIKPSTWLLWFSPLLIVIGGAVFVVTILRRRNAMLKQMQAGAADAPRSDASKNPAEDW